MTRIRAAWELGREWGRGGGVLRLHHITMQPFWVRWAWLSGYFWGRT